MEALELMSVEFGVQMILGFLRIFVGFPKKIFEAALILPQIVAGKGYLKFYYVLLQGEKVWSDLVWTQIYILVGV